jgi:predicted Fe-S protein YdhL (DUF1289 family)
MSESTHDRPTVELPDHLIDQSPCVGVCQLDAHDRCLGCARSRAEIAAWGSMTPEQRDASNRRNLPNAHPAVAVRLLGYPLDQPQRRGGRRNRQR